MPPSFKKVLGIGYSEGDLPKEHWDRMKRLASNIVMLPKDSPMIPKELTATDCLLVKLGATVDRTMMDMAPELRYIGMLGTGYGRIDTKYAATKKIAVCNIAGYSTEAVAELVFAVLLEHAREVERARRQAREGNYSEAGFTGHDLRGKALGIVGLGRIGSRVAEIGSNGFQMDVRYWSRTHKKNYEKMGVKYQDLETLLKSSDFVSLHLAFNDETKNFLDEKRINLIKSGTVVVNLAPMELVDTSALERRLERGDIVFILDHSDELSEAQAKQLAKYSNCIMYPPIGYTTVESTLAKQTVFLDNIENFLRGRPTNKVN